MNGFKPNAKMSSTCHYSYGGEVMKKAKGGAVAKKATGGAMKQAYQTQIRRNPRDTGVALGPDDRPLGMPTKPKGGGMMGSPVKMMGNGPFGPRNPNGPRKPMGSSSPMSGGIMAAMNSMVNKGRSQQSAAQQNLGTQAYNDYTKAMPRKKGGMAKGMK